MECGDYDFDIDCDDGKCIVKKMKIPGKERNFEVIIYTDEDEECRPAKSRHKVMRFGGHDKKHDCSCCSRCCSCDCGGGRKNNEIMIKIEISGCGQVHHDVRCSKGDCREKVKKYDCSDCGCGRHGIYYHGKKSNKAPKKIKIYKGGCESGCGGDRDCEEDVWIFDCDEKP